MVLTGCVSGVCNEGTAAVLAAAGPARALDIDVTSFKLDNGMQVVVIPDHRTPVVTHMVWYRNGSADDPVGKSGIAHFLEHLMFKGTPAHPDASFSRIVAENGGAENAFTTTDYTGYFQKIASFCFTEQVLKPGERVQMPVSFFVDPEMLKDPEGMFVKEITLSYTFYQTPLTEDQSQAALAAPATKAVN